MWKALKLKLARALGIHYQPNDPTTPDLAQEMDIPALPNPCPPFAVEGFTGKEGAPGSLETQAVGVYTTMVSSLRYVQGMLRQPIVRWPALCKLVANPRSGKMFNAYYDRYFLNFFYDTDPVTNQMIYTCDSTDVVSHELGHAILDSIRPDLWAVQCVEIQSFHEAFGDVNAMLTGLSFPSIINKVLTETNGDLRQSNVVSRIAEQMGLAIYHARGGKDVPANFALRNALNTFQYAIPENLPTRAPDNQLAGEPHSFSRVFAGAWYDSLTKVYDKNKVAGMPPEAALIDARDRMARITYNGVRFAPVNARFFGSVLKAMIEYDTQNNMGCSDCIQEGFAMHNIQSPTSLAVNLCGNSETESMHLLATNQVETARIKDFDSGENPLCNLIIELANKHPAGATFMADTITELGDAVKAAAYSLQVLQERNRVGMGPSTGSVHDHEFTVIDGRLIRNYYCCWHHTI